MPRKPGTKSSRTTYDTSQVLVSSFIMMHEEWLWRRPCCITDCDHRMGPKTDEVGWIDWKSCDEKQIAAYVVLDDGIWDTQVGIACPCHVTEILEEHR